MEIFKTALTIIGLLFLCFFIIPWIVGDMCKLIVALYKWDADELAETCTYEMAAELYEKYTYHSAWLKLGRKCKKCGGTSILKSELTWNEGSKEHRFTEKFLKCSDCGHTVSDQWPQYW